MTEVERINCRTKDAAQEVDTRMGAVVEATVAAGESVIKCPSPLNVLKDTYTIISVIEHVQTNISTHPGLGHRRLHGQLCGASAERLGLPARLPQRTVAQLALDVRVTLTPPSIFHQ